MSIFSLKLAALAMYGSDGDDALENAQSTMGIANESLLHSSVLYFALLIIEITRYFFIVKNP